MTATTQSPVQTATLEDAKKSDTFVTIATIAGGKAHQVFARTLLEDATYEKQVGHRFVPGKGYQPRYEEATLTAGTILYYGTMCGTQRNAKWGMAYANQYQPAEQVTCSKCAK